MGLKISGNGTVVEHLPQHPKVEGFNPGAVTDFGTEEMAEKCYSAEFFIRLA